jgi:hypothetical protein
MLYPTELRALYAHSRYWILYGTQEIYKQRAWARADLTRERSGLRGLTPYKVLARLYEIAIEGATNPI